MTGDLRQIISYLVSMKTVAILVPENSVLQAIVDPQYCFQAVNQFLRLSHQEPLFQVQLVGLKKKIRLSKGQYVVHPDKLLKEVNEVDILFIPALAGNMGEAIMANRKVLPWIVEQYRKGSEVASLCVGAFLLASTGLLDGKKCSTHWSFANEFKEMFPAVELQDGQIVTEESRIYSSGGANSYWNLLLHLVEKFASRETAILVAKYFAIDIDRLDQSKFAIFQGQKAHGDEAICTAQEYIEKHYTEKLSIEMLADKVALGRRSFERRFKRATCNSVLEYIQRVKVEAAKRSFESCHKNIHEVMYDSGYTDTKAFRTTFKKVTGLTPLEYRNKYQKTLQKQGK